MQRDSLAAMVTRVPRVGGRPSTHARFGGGGRRPNTRNRRT